MCSDSAKSCTADGPHDNVGIYISTGRQGGRQHRGRRDQESTTESTQESTHKKVKREMWCRKATSTLYWLLVFSYLLVVLALPYVYIFMTHEHHSQNVFVDIFCGITFFVAHLGGAIVLNVGLMELVEECKRGVGTPSSCSIPQCRTIWIGIGKVLPWLVITPFYLAAGLAVFTAFSYIGTVGLLSEGEGEDNVLETVKVGYGSTAFWAACVMPLLLVFPNK